MKSPRDSRIAPSKSPGRQSGAGASSQPNNRGRNIYLPHPAWAPWVYDFIEECVQFPNGAYDDQVDAVTQALLRWHEVPREQTYIQLCDIVEISPI
jgi:phage terminase large subunit-like protein